MHGFPGLFHGFAVFVLTGGPHLFTDGADFIGVLFHPCFALVAVGAHDLADLLTLGLVEFDALEKHACTLTATVAAFTAFAMTFAALTLPLAFSVTLAATGLCCRQWR